MDKDKIEQNWNFRQLFVRIEKKENNLMALVTNDGWFVDRFMVESENEAQFMDECKVYLESDRFKEKLKQQRGY